VRGKEGHLRLGERKKVVCPFEGGDSVEERGSNFRECGS
jgi:hypothetical protein